MAVGVNVTPVPTTIWAEDIDKQLEDLRDEREKKQGEMEELEERLEELHNEIGTLEEDITVTQAQLNQVAFKAQQLEVRIEDLGEELSELRADLSEKENFRDQLVRQLYKKKRTPFWQVFLADDGFSNLSKNVFYRSLSIGDLKSKIISLNNDISEVAEQKEQLAESKESLDRELARIAVLRDQLAEQKEEAEVEAAQVQKEKEEISFKLAEVSAEIRKLMQAKLSATQERMTVGSSEMGDQNLPDPDFSPAFAVVSHGYPHRVGLSQYGAKGRAEAEQNYKEILSAYYDIDEDDIEDYTPVEEIHVYGCSAGRYDESNCKNEGYKWYDEVIDFEKYLKSLGEMPSSWPKDALKAQAVAARTYALYYIDSNEEGTICPSPYCQAYIGQEKGGAWNGAVEDTEGEVIIKGGTPIAAYYCSTAGGFTRLTNDWEPINVFSADVSYDKRVIDNPQGTLAGWEDSYGRDSPWMKWAHYDEDVEDPWLTEEELVDLINVALLYEKDSDLKGRLYQEDPVAFDDVEPGMSAEDVREELGDDAVDEIDSGDIEMEWSSDGYTSKVKFGDDLEIDGDTFAQVFNMRSPGYTVVYSSLYSIKVVD